MATARNFDWPDCYRSVSGENGQHWHALNFKTLSNAKKTKKKSRHVLLQWHWVPQEGAVGRRRQIVGQINQFVMDNGRYLKGCFIPIKVFFFFPFFNLPLMVLGWSWSPPPPPPPPPISVQGGKAIFPDSNYVFLLENDPQFVTYILSLEWLYTRTIFPLFICLFMPCCVMLTQPS